ncbi:MAG: saccharopine dehydrogenase NADP-binding domain-containing protein, partial [Lysobacter sp.]
MLERGWEPVLSGRDAGKLAALAQAFPGLEQRPASVDDPAALDRALAGTVAVIHCAGPFTDTGAPLIEAALRAGIHYLDTAAEQQPVIAAFERYAGQARDAGIAVVPAMAFYGGLADLLATAAMGDWTQADEVRIAVALDSWHPTEGTRLTGKRNTARRLLVDQGALTFVADPMPTGRWVFAE